MASLKTLTIAGVTYTLKAVYDGDGNEITQVYVKKESGKGLSSNDFTNDLKTKLEGIESGAQKNTVTSVAGKVGAVTVSKSDVGLGNVDNTSDLSKPISTATQTALDNKVSLSGNETVNGIKTFTSEIKANQIANENDNVMLCYKSTENKVVLGGSTIETTLMGKGERPTYSNDGSNFEGKPLALYSDIKTIFDEEIGILMEVDY